jgi:hypothetical protein
MFFATPLFFCLAGLYLETEQGSHFTIDYKDFQIPITVDLDLREKMEEIRLFVSTDRGKTWKQVTSVSVDKKSFDFHAPKDGLYLFKAQTVFKDMHVVPEDISDGSSALKIRVQTTKKAALDNAENSEEEIATLREQVETLEKELTAVRKKLEEVEKKLAKPSVQPKP